MKFLQKSPYFFFLFFFGLFFSFWSSNSFAVTKTSTGATWNNGANWSPAGVPDPADDVIINTAMTLDVDAVVNTLTINTTRSLNLAGFNFTVSGTTTINGSGVINDNNDAGANIFIGAITIPTGAGGLNSANNSSWEFRGGIAATTTGIVTLTGTGTISFTTNDQTFSGTSNITLNNLTVASGITLTYSNTGTLTVNAGTTINGTMAISSTAGLKTFIGAVSVGASGTISNSANAPFQFRGGISNGGTVSIASGTGAKTFATNDQTLSGSGNITLAPVTINAGITITNNNTGISTINGAFTLNGGFDDGNSGGSNVFGGLITIPTGGSLTTSFNSNYEFQGGITTTGSGFVNLTGTGIIQFTATQTINQLGPVTISNITVPSGVTLSFSNTSNFTNLGTTSVDGSISVLASAGTKRFDGLVTVSATGSFTNNNNAVFEFRNGISNAGTFTLNSGTGNKNFTTNNQALSGPITINNIVIDDVVVTNNGTLTSTSITGTTVGSNLTQGTNANLIYNGTGTILATGSLTATASGNTVTYGLTSVNIRSTTGYYNLTTSGSTTKTIFQNTTIFNELNIGAGTTFQASTLNVNANIVNIAGTFAKSGAGIITIEGLATLSGSGIFSLATGNPSVEFQSNIVHNSTGNSNFGSGTVSFSTNNQTISGTGSGTFTFGGNVFIASGIEVKNQITPNVTITGTLDGEANSSKWINENGAVLVYNNITQPFATFGVLDATANPNTVTYNRGGAQTIRNTTYFNLGIGGSGAKSLTDGIVTGSFIGTGTATVSAIGTLTFSSSSTANLTQSTALVFNDILVNKTGSSLTVTGSGNLTMNALTITAGTFSMGTTAKTLTLNGDLSGAGTLSTIGAASHIIDLKGVNNTIGNYTSVAGNRVSYTSTAQTIFGSPNYRQLVLGGTGIKTLGGDVSVNDTLFFINTTLLALESQNLTMAPGTRIKAGLAVSPWTNASFGVTRMIVTNGSGTVILNGTSSGQFTSFSWSNSGKNSGLLPIGTTGFYSPFEITGLTATVAGTGSVSARAVATKQPNVPYYLNSAIKYWELNSTNLSAISASMSFTYNNPAEVIGNQLLYEGRVWDGSTLATPASPSAPGSIPFTTTGSSFISGSWTAVDPTNRNVFYTYISGDYGNPGIWTTDPSGSTLINSAVPGSGDQVVILTGRTVTTSIGRTCASLQINSGATFDITNSTGNNFGPVSGSGLYRQSTITLPTANFTAFVASGAGTFEYYNLSAGTHVISSSLGTYNNLLVTNSSGSNFAIAQDHNIQVNGNFNLSRSGAGTVTFTLGNSANGRTKTILGNATVGSGCTWNIGSFNVTHTVNISGNLTNSGTILFNNTAAAYTASTTGQATVNMLGATANTTFTSNTGSASRFFNFQINKSTGYELFISAAVGAGPEFWSNSNTILVQNGTLRLGANVSVSLLGYTGGNYDLGTSSSIPTFWVDGGSVTFIGGNSIVIYGTLKITSGLIDQISGASSIVIRETGYFLIEGGTVNAQMFRTSNTATTHRGAFEMKGGIFNLNVPTGTPQAGYSVFTLPYPDNVFKMSGGTINITRRSAGPAGGIQIASGPGNYEVIGGTINITISPGLNFDIACVAPLNHVTISKLVGAAAAVRLNGITGSNGNESIAAQPLEILGNLTINGTNSPVFNAQNSDLSVKGNFSIASGGTYQTTTQSTIFHGSGNQIFTIDGSLSTGLSSVVLTKASSTLTLAGTVTPVTIRSNLTINSGTLADAGKTINVAGNIVNNGTHSGAGKITLNGSTNSQSISGISNCNFGNLEMANTNGAAGSTQVTISSNLILSGNLTLTTDRVTAIGSRQISLGASGAISGTFSTNRFLQTNGFLSDGGIKKTFSNTSAFLFPFGSGTNYTPATIQFTAAPTTYGNLDVRPVATKQLYVTDPDCFDLYWKVKTSGFSGIPANSVNYTFNYGNLTDNTSYIPSFYDFLAISYTTINDVTQVNEATNNIHFTGVSYTDGDYTAGNPIAFGVVTPFYSRATGNWNNPNTWSNTGHGGAAAVSIPASNSPVIIGDGSTYFHTVTVTTNGTISGSLVVDAGSTLDCQTTTGNNFGAIPYATAGGSGTVRISSSSATAEFPAGDFGLFFMEDGGTTEYYSTGAQDFTIPASTASPTVIAIDSYKWLNINPGNGRTISFPNKNLTVFQNLTINGHSAGLAYFAPANSRIVTINGNLTITQGILELGSANSQNISVLGNTTVSNGGTIRAENSGTTVHSLNLNGNLFNEGVLSLNNASKATLSFLGNTSSLFNGANGGASVSLSNLVVNKGTSTATELEINTLGSFSAPTNNWLTIPNGMLKWSKGTTITLTDQPGPFTIVGTAGLTINHSSAQVNVGMANSANGDLVLEGKLIVNAGLLNIGDDANNQNNDLEYSSSGLPEFTVSGNAIVNINGQVRRSTVVQSGSLHYTQTGNSQVLVRGKNTDAPTSLTYDRAKFEILNSGSEFHMSGNSLLTISRSGTVSGVYYDIYLDPSVSTVTGGEIRIGNGSTPASQNFFMASNIQFWNLTIDGTTSTKTLTLVGNPLQVQRNLAIESNSILNTQGLNVTIGGNFTNQNNNNATGLAVGGFRTVNANQVTTFNGSTASQTITGASGNLTNFANLVIQNSFSGGAVNLAANSNIRIASALSINQGGFNTSNNLATVLGNITNQGGHSSTGAGYIIMGGTSPQTISSSGTAIFGSLRLSNAAGGETTCPITVNGDLNLVSGLFYINNHLLTLGVSASVSGTFTSSSMIRINGVTSDGGVTKNYPNSPLDFTFPIGTTLRYTPVRINVTSNSVVGTVNIKPVAVRHPATTDPASKELSYYWRTSSTGFNGSTVVSHTYNYLASDVNGNEAAYVTGRFFNNAWTPTFGISGTVNAASDLFTLSGVSYFDGDFTAGEPSEFNILPTYYSRNATLGGNFNTPASWSNDQILQHAGASDGTIPNFNPIVIASGHTITATAGGYNTVSAVVDGQLDLANTIGHNFGDVSGTGKIRQTPTAGNAYVFPGGDYSLFTNTGGGTFEFSGTIPGTLSTQATYNNIEFSGSDIKSLSSSNLSINGNWSVISGTVTNPSNSNIDLAGNWSNLVGLGGFAGGTGTVNLVGGSQTLTGATNFYNLSTTGAGTKLLGSSQNVTNNLALTNGIIETAANTLTVEATASVTGGSAASHVFGTLRKGIPASTASSTFQIGDGSLYAPVTVQYTGTTNSGGYLSANTTSGDHPDIYFSGIDQTKTANRHWELLNSGVTGFTGYNITFNFNPADLDGGANTSSFIIGRYQGGNWTLPTVGTLTGTSSQAISISGTVFGEFQVGQPNDGHIWTGLTNTNWNVATNWIPNVVPTSSINAIIGNVVNQPTFTSGSDGNCKKLILYTGATPNVPSGYNLNIFDNIESLGNTIDGDGHLIIQGAPSTLSGDLTVDCNLDIPATRNFTIGLGATLNIGKDLTIAGTLNHNNQPIYFTGSSPSLLSGNLSFFDMVIQKSASSNVVTLGSNATVSNELDMQSGDVDLNGRELNLGATGTLINESELNSVTGRTGGMIKATRNLNAPTSNNVAGLGAEITSLVNMGSTEIRRRHNQVLFGYGFGSHRTYGITPTNNSALDATLVFHYFDHELNTDAGPIIEGDLDLWRFNGLSWDRQMASVNIGANTLTKANIPQFSDWTSASYINNPLPLNLISFEVSCKNNKPMAWWKTARETDNDHFVLETSEDGRNWIEWGTTAGGQTTQSERTYEFNLDGLPAGMKQVRLIAIDKEGNRSIMPTRSLNCGLSAERPKTTAFPNPTTGVCYLALGETSETIVDIQIINVLGKVVGFYSVNPDRKNNLKLELGGLPTGVYTIKIGNSDSVGKPELISVILQ